MAQKRSFGIGFIVLVGIILAAGCTSSVDSSAGYGSSDTGEGTQGDSSSGQNILPGENSDSSGDSSSVPDKEKFVGNWRIYSEYIFYDTGGSNWLDTPVTRQLELGSNGKWVFGSSTGTWKIEEITDADWEKWGVDPYGPTRRMVMNNWNKVGADGPIEETKTNVDFIWVIYRAEPPVVSYPGQIQMKFSHAVLN